MENDWQAAEDLIQQAFELNPGHPLARNLQTVVLDRKRDHLVNECFSQARRLRAAGDFAGALARIEQALATYPNEKRLLQMRETCKVRWPRQNGQKRAAVTSKNYETSSVKPKRPPTSRSDDPIGTAQRLWLQIMRTMRKFESLADSLDQFRSPR